MKKILYIIAGVLIVISIILIIFYKNKTAAPQVSQPATTAIQIPNLPSESELAKQGKTSIAVKDGGVVINNPYKNATTVVSGNADVQKTPNYEIVYLATSKSFVISLSGSNLADSRSQAEQAFLDSLGVSKTDACKLTVSLGVAPEVNKAAAGKNYGLSFCPNGKPLPTN
ncbi:MAG: hypothetical protein WC726_00200 [Parcubacteria group bacterium]|jgi:hypothetical protein